MMVIDVTRKGWKTETRSMLLAKALFRAISRYSGQTLQDRKNYTALFPNLCIEGVPKRIDASSVERWSLKYSEDLESGDAP